MVYKLSIKLLNILTIFSILIVYLLIPCKVLADYENGDILDSEISIGNYNDEGDILVTKTISKTDNLGEYKVSFDIKGIDVSTNTKLDSYTVFVLDASMSMSGTKWNKAVSAAINFSNILVNDSTNNYLALVTFNSNGYKLRGFENSVFSDFGNISRGTNYNEGLSKAYSYLENVDGIKNIVFISDGEPNSNNYSDILNTIKNDDINIYSLAYELDSGSNAYDKLLNISTNNYVYEVSSDDIVDTLVNIANEIIKVNAGSNGIITDYIGDNFNFLSGDVVLNGKSVTIDVGDITSINKSFDFIIKIDDDLDTGWYPTNNGFKLNYIDSSNNLRELSTDRSASVYNLSNKVNLTINYYNDNEIFKSVTKIINRNTYIDDSILDINSNMDTGYYLDSVSSNNFNISDDTVIDVKYSKINNLKYIVNYYKDLELYDSLEYKDIIYGTIPSYENKDITGYSICLINNNTNPIIDNNTIIDVYYCRNDYKYIVNYFYNNVLENSVEYKAKYNDIIDNYINKDKEVYVLNKVENIPLSISNDINSNVINVYYELKDINYTINYLDSNNNKISKSKEGIGKYHDIVIEKYKEIDNYNLVSSDTVDITLDDDNNTINFYYELKHGDVIIKYVDEDNNYISDDTIISGNYGDNYSVSIKEIDGYTYIGDEYVYGVISDDNEVILRYKKDTLKNVIAPLTGISNKYNYLFFISIIGIISLLGIKLFYKLKK